MSKLPHQSSLTPVDAEDNATKSYVDTNVGLEQRFRYTATGSEGTDFSITLPAARASDDYIITASLSDVAAIFGMSFPNGLAGDRTTTIFRVVTTAPLVSGDIIEFRVADPI